MQYSTVQYSTWNKACALLWLLLLWAWCAHKHARGPKQSQQTTLNPKVSAHFTLSFSYLSVGQLDTSALGVYSRTRLLSHSSLFNFPGEEFERHAGLSRWSMGIVVVGAARRYSQAVSRRCCCSSPQCRVAQEKTKSKKADSTAPPTDPTAHRPQTTHVEQAQREKTTSWLSEINLEIH